MLEAHRDIFYVKMFVLLRVRPYSEVQGGAYRENRPHDLAEDTAAEKTYECRKNHC